MTTPKLKSPLRYPGGKSRALAQIRAQLPPAGSFEVFREPFTGGGSVYLAIRSWFPDVLCWINDLNPQVASFWQSLHRGDDSQNMLHWIKGYKATKTGRELYATCLEGLSRYGWADWRLAVDFFVLNRITFSGLAQSGGYSERAFRERFTDSSIQRVESLAAALNPNGRTSVTNDDFEIVITATSHHCPPTFIFLDPPYLSATKSALYGNKGDLHTGFDHARLATTLRATPHKWLMTYDDTPAVRELYQDWAHIEPWSLQYGMNNYKQGKAAKGAELFIRNY